MKVLFINKIYNIITHIIINAICRCRTVVGYKIVVSVVDQQKTSWFYALFEIGQCLFLFALIAKTVQQMGEGVSQANDGVEASVQ